MFAIRFFLGIFEAAFISGAPYLTTVLYPRAVSCFILRISCMIVHGKLGTVMEEESRIHVMSRGA